MNDFFRLDHDEARGIATLELSRPDALNALTPAFFGALREAVQTLSDAGRTRALVLRSTGRHFSAGMSLEVFEAGYALLRTGSAREREAFQAGLRRLMACVDVLDQARFPTICAVQGGCVGGAFDLAVACDVRLCTEDAFFTVQEIHIGMAADLGVLQRLQRVLPQGLAREMAYTGMRLPAARALASGLVNAVLPDLPTLHAQAQSLALDIAAKSPLAVAGSKQALNFARDHGTEAALAQMTLLQSAIFDIDEMMAAIAAWKERRTASFEPLRGVTPG